MASDLSRLNEFVKYARSSAWDTIKKNPARLLYGAVDPASTWAWNKVLGRDDKPILNQLGSPMGGGGLGLSKNGGVYADARKDGLSSGEVGMGQKFFGIGDTIAGFYGGSAAAGALGGGGSAGSSAGGLGSGASVAPDGAGLLGTGSEATAAGAGYSSAAGPTVASQFAPAAQSVGSAGGSVAGGAASSNLITQGQGLLGNSQPQQQQVQPMYPTQAPDPQRQQAERLRLLQQMQLQQLRQKPNKTIEEYQQLAQADRGQGLLA